VDISFLAPLDTGGIDISGYKYAIDNDVDASYNNVNSNGRIPGLRRYTNYTIYLKATNNIGNSSVIDASITTLPTIPDMPTIYLASRNQSITVSFVQPLDDGGNTITKSYYAINVNDDASYNIIPSNNFTIDNLSKNTEYTIYGKVQNSVGNSNVKYVRIKTTPTIPDPPTIISIQGGYKSFTVFFSPPSDNGGNEILKYNINSISTITDGNEVYIDTNNKNTIYINDLHILPNNIYSYTYEPLPELIKDYNIAFSAVTSMGNSMQALSAFGKTYILPQHPNNLTTTPNKRSIDISFSAPLNGGNTITKYNVYYKSISEETYTKLSFIPNPYINQIVTYSIKELIPLMSYTLYVKSENNAGESITQSQVYSATPYSTPDAPLITSITDSTTSSTVYFSIGNLNGSDVSGYYVEYSFDNLDLNTDSNWIPIKQITSETQYVFDISNLTSGIKYGIRLRINSDKGYSDPPYEIAYCRPFTLPDPPESINILAKNWMATINYALGDNKGRDITEILYSLNSGITVVSNGMNLTIVLSNLVNYREYTIRIRSKNDAGYSDWSPDYTFRPYYSAVDIELIKRNFSGNSSLTKAQLYALTVKNSKGNTKNLF
jgi:titin